MNIEAQLLIEIKKAIKSEFDIDLEQNLSLQPTKSDFEGDITFVVFQILKFVKGNPETIGNQIGAFIKENSDLVTDYNTVKGFLNFIIDHKYWVDFLINIDNSFWTLPSTGETVVLEYCGPNTNKPLHLGHVRNMLIGWSLAEILKQAGNDVHKVNIYNDRGIAICKSMVAWQQFANGETPDSTGEKGDHFVGKYYVKYAQEEKKQAEAVHSDLTDEREIVKQTPINKEAQALLQKWEAGDLETKALWQKMNDWVYAGFNETYNSIGVDFETDYLESETYQLGKEIVETGLASQHFYRKDDQSTWVDLEDAGLDQKLLLRSDGTSVYITQDLGTAELRFNDYNMDRSIYVVGNEQDYHFKVLKAVLQKIKKPFADGIQHLSYGMVDLPSGKMKSREGTVVDADDLISTMITTAQKNTDEKGKIEGYTQQEKENLYRQIGLGALKFFILRVDPKKRMLFNPEESIDVHGFTGPFIQYTHARIRSLLRKNQIIDQSNNDGNSTLEPEEINLIQHLHDYPKMLNKAAKDLDHSLVAHYAFDLAKLFNQFWERVQVSKEEDLNKRNLRIILAKKVGECIKVSLGLLGIESPERM